MEILDKFIRIIMGVALGGVMVLAVLLFTQVVVEYITGGLSEKELKERKKQRKYLGKEYTKLLGELSFYKFVFKDYSIIEECKRDIENYYVLLLKYEYMFTLVKNMCDEADKGGVLYDKRFRGKVDELFQEFEKDYKEIRGKLKEKKERETELEVKVINKQLDEELVMLKDLRKAKENRGSV